MKPWSERNIEAASLLNPAFLALLMQNAIKSYSNQVGQDAPFELPFVILPLVLHKSTRERFPNAVTTPFSSWITSPQTVSVKSGFSERAEFLAPYIREAIIFACKANGLSFGALSRIGITGKVKKSFPGATEEVKSCIVAASFCGKWLGRAGNVQTIFALLGVKP